VLDIYVDQIYSYVTSDTLILEAIDSNTSFNIHEGLLRSISPALSAACNNDWKECNSRRYKFREEVTEQVLLCFLTWAYSGDYQDDSGDGVLLSPMSIKSDTNGQQNAFGSTTKGKSKKEKKNRIAVAVQESTSEWPQTVERSAEELLANELPVENTHGPDGITYESSSKGVSTPAMLTAGKENAVHPLLLHAKLYVFAHTYLIEPLKVCAKQKIVDQLERLDSLFEGNERAAVFDILAYTFMRLPEDDLLLHWLARYASWKLDELRQMPTRFDDLLSGEDSTFVELLLRYVSRSSSNPFTIGNDQIVPRYPMSTPAVRYDSWRGY